MSKQPSPYHPPDLTTPALAIDWFHSLCAPRIAIACTDEVNNLLYKEYHIQSLARFLNPLASTSAKINHLDTHYTNTYAQKVTRVDNYNVQFIDFNHLPELCADPNKSVQILAQAVKGYSNEYDQLENESVIESTDLAYKTPWFDLYRYWQPQLHPCVNFESIRHPTMFLFVVTTKSPDPVVALSKLNNFISTHPLLNQGWLDPGVLRYYLVLHCGGASSDPKCKPILDNIHRSFGQNLSLVTINTSTTPPNENPWDNIDFDTYYQSQFSPNSNLVPKTEYLGIDVDATTIESVGRFMSALVNQTLIPYLERCTLHWNETIAAPRQGLTGRLFTASKKYFGSSSPSQNTFKSGQVNTFTYSHTMSEALLRRLGDYALMLRDYNLAHATYQTAARTYSADKSYKHLAAAQEMVTISLVLLNQYQQVDNAHEQALVTYVQKAHLPTYATRATILTAALCTALNQHDLATRLYLRMANMDTDPTRCALFFEQAASIQYNTHNKRKSSLFYVLAATKFAKSSLRVHAMRCLTQTQALAPKSWPALVDYIRLSLGRQFFHLGALQRAISEMLPLVHPGQLLPLDELIYLYSQNPIAGPGMPLPWHDLAVPVPSISVLPVSPICVHEKAAAILQITNPLRVNISVSALVVVVVPEDNQSSIIEICVASDSNKINCGPLETKSTDLNINGLNVGTVTLKYVTYRLFDVIPIRVPLTSTREICVIAPRARLQVVWDIPSVIFASQVMCIPVTLTNSGFVAADLITLKILDHDDDDDTIETSIAKKEEPNSSVMLVVDPTTPLPQTLASGESITVNVWSHWHASSVTVEWKYGPYTELSSIQVTLVPLVQRARALWVFDHSIEHAPKSLLIKVEALHQALEGYLVGVGVSSIERVNLAPRQIVTHLVHTAANHLLNSDNHKHCTGCWPEWWTGPTNQLFHLDKYTQATNAVQLYLAWRLNAWSGFIPITVSPPPLLGIQLYHSDCALPMKSVPISISICYQEPVPSNESASQLLIVKVEVSSDAYVVITGLISETLVMSPGMRTVLERGMIPLVNGVHDIATEVRVSAQWQQPTNLGNWDPDLALDVPLQPSYIHVSE